VIWKRGKQIGGGEIQKYPLGGGALGKKFTKAGTEGKKDKHRRGITFH